MFGCAYWGQSYWGRSYWSPECIIVVPVGNGPYCIHTALLCPEVIAELQAAVITSMTIFPELITNMSVGDIESVFNAPDTFSEMINCDE